VPKMLHCSFCGKPIKPGTGMAYVRNDGVILHFCSSKCFKSAIRMGRDPRRLKWARGAGGQSAERSRPARKEATPT